MGGGTERPGAGAFHVALSLAIALTANAVEPGPTLVLDHPLPAEIPWAFDVRWAADDRVWVAAGADGVVEIELGGERPSAPRQVMPGGSGRSGFWLSSRLAVTRDHLLVAGLVRAYGWRARSGGEVYTVPMALVLDLDASGDQVAVLGAVEDARGRFAADGALAWRGAAGREIPQLDAIYLSTAGRGAAPMAACWFHELGSLRFLDDGSLVVVPGVEPGVFWYRPSGELLRAWDSGSLGMAEEPCTRANPGMAADPELRVPWLNARRVVDDVLPHPEGAALVLREHQDGVTTWDLVVLRRDGSTVVHDLPLRSTSGWGRVRGDARQRRLALLLSEHGKERPAGRPRLVVVELP